MGKMFELIKEGLSDAISYEKGKIDLRTKEVRLPGPPKKFSAQDVRNLRNRLHFSQQVFAAYLNVNVKTVQAWESGLRNPTSSSLRLLEMIDSESKREKIFRSISVA